MEKRTVIVTTTTPEGELLDRKTIEIPGGMYWLTMEPSVSAMPLWGHETLMRALTETPRFE